MSFSRISSELITWNKGWRKDKVTDYIKINKDQLMVNRHLVSKRRKIKEPANLRGPHVRGIIANLHKLGINSGYRLGMFIGMSQ